MSKVSVLLTGPNGFLGSHILEALLLNGYGVTILKRTKSDLWRIQSLIHKVRSYDVDTHGIEIAFSENKFDFVIHTACNYGRNQTSSSKIVETNILLGIKLVESCIKFDVKAFISTDTFFNNKQFNQNYLRAYTLSKKQFEEWLIEISNKIKIINLNLHHMYGPKDDSSKFIPWVINQLKENADEIKLSSGLQKRDFIYVTDVVSAYLIILEKNFLFGNYTKLDVGTGQIQNLKFFLEKLDSIFKRKNPSNNTKLVFGAIPEREEEINQIKIDISNLLNLGWKPKVSIETAINKII